MQKAWVVLLLLGVSLAGCSDDAADSEETQDDEIFEDFGDAEVSDDKGIIRGVVVTEAIQPLAGAKVTLVQTRETVETNENGAFLFSDLDPGAYFVKARAVGFETIQSSVEVEAGVESPPALRVVLPADPDGTPYFKPHDFSGFIQCSTNVVAICGGVRDFTGLGDDTYSSLYDTDANITHLQSEMVWESTQTFGDQFKVNHRYATRDNFEGGFYDGSITSGTGNSPLLVVTDAEVYNKHNVGDDYELLLSIFAGPSDTVPVLGAAINQNYQMFIHEFHGYAPPEGWRFTDGDGVPGPQ